MALTLELKPDVEARLLHGARVRGVAVGEYVETLLGNEKDLDAKQGGTEAYISRVQRVLKRFDELPRAAGPIDPDQIIEFDRWGVPRR